MITSQIIAKGHDKKGKAKERQIKWELNGQNASSCD
jgi:hypothetical protein